MWKFLLISICVAQCSSVCSNNQSQKFKKSQHILLFHLDLPKYISNWHTEASYANFGRLGWWHAESLFCKSSFGWTGELNISIQPARRCSLLGVCGRDWFDSIHSASEIKAQQKEKLIRRCVWQPSAHHQMEWKIQSCDNCG